MFVKVVMGGSISEEMKTDRIVVEPRFEVCNGIPGVKRDIVLRLCNLLWYKSKFIRMLFGMCDEHYKWKRHSNFVKSRTKAISIPAFFSRSSERYSQTPMVTHTKYIFDCVALMFETVFLTNKIEEGVYQWMVKIEYGFGYSAFRLGATKFIQRNADNVSLGAMKRSCCFAFDTHAESILLGVKDWPKTLCKETPVPQNATVAIEVDSSAGTLSFFVNERKVPRIIAGVKVPMHLAISGYGDQFFTPLSFCRLRLPTTSPFACTSYECSCF